MGYWDYFWGTLRDYHGDPFPHCPFPTKNQREGSPWGWKPWCRVSGLRVEGSGLEVQGGGFRG